jgi:hypothetical protein
MRLFLKNLGVASQLPGENFLPLAHAEDVIVAAGWAYFGCFGFAMPYAKQTP